MNDNPITGRSTFGHLRDPERHKDGHPQVRLMLSNIRRDHPDYLLIGGADISCAITARNVALANDLAAALRRAGYTSAMRVLDAEESLALVGADSNGALQWELRE
jgi:hypothetical protein